MIGPFSKLASAVLANGTPLSDGAFERALAVIPGGSMRQATWFGPHPPYAVRGQDCWIHTVDGGLILDCANNFFSLIHGHAFAPVVEALRLAIGDGTAFGLPTEHEVRLAEALSLRSPRCAQVRFCNSGTEAVMFAIKAARALTQRTAVAKFEGAYHGAYDWMEVSLGSDPSNWGPAGQPMSVSSASGTPDHVLKETVVLPYGNPARCEEILDDLGPRLAAVVIDPLASRVGMISPSSELLKVLKSARERHGFLLICDEVITFRLSFAGAHPLFDLEPDLITLGKVIGGGLPIGAVAGPADRMMVFDHTHGKPAVPMGGTFTANPLTMVAGLAALAALDESALERLNGLGARLRSDLNCHFMRHGIPAQVTGAGSLFRLHLTQHAVIDYRSSRPDAAMADALTKIHAAVLNNGILLTPNCSGALSTPMDGYAIDRLQSTILDATKLVFERDGFGAKQ